MFRVAACGLLLVGCHTVFGLDPVGETCPDDRDCDAVLDSADNCPDTPNSDQRDLERDGVGDACDPCVAPPRSEARDADMDGIADLDDGCPAVSDASQTDADDDGIGDACDPDPASANQLRCFHDFRDVRYPSTLAWEIDLQAWSYFGGVFQHFVPDGSASVRLAVSGLHPEVSRFALLTTARGTDGRPPPAQLGLALGGSAAAPGVRCVLTSRATFGDAFALVAADGSELAGVPRSSAASNPVYRIQMLVERRELATAIECRLHVAGEAPLSVTGVAPALDGTPSVGLVASRVEANFFDLTIHD